MTTLVVPKRHKRFTGKKVSLTISAWTMGFLFFAPYLQMLLTALKPKEEADEDQDDCKVDGCH